MRNTTGGCPPPSISRKAKVFVVRFFCIVFYHDPQHISSEYVHTLTAFEKLLLFKGWPTGPLRKGTSQIRLDGYDPGSSSRSMDHIRPWRYRHPASRLQPAGSSKGGCKKSTNRSIKYICPCCGTIIRAAREVNVTCADCEEPFEKA